MQPVDRVPKQLTGQVPASPDVSRIPRQTDSGSDADDGDISSGVEEVHSSAQRRSSRVRRDRARRTSMLLERRVSHTVNPTFELLAFWVDHAAALSIPAMILGTISPVYCLAMIFFACVMHSSETMFYPTLPPSPVAERRQSVHVSFLEDLQYDSETLTQLSSKLQFLKNLGVNLDQTRRGIVETCFTQFLECTAAILKKNPGVRFHGVASGLAGSSFLQIVPPDALQEAGSPGSGFAPIQIGSWSIHVVSGAFFRVHIRLDEDKPYALVIEIELQSSEKINPIEVHTESAKYDLRKIEFHGDLREVFLFGEEIERGWERVLSEEVLSQQTPSSAEASFAEDNPSSLLPIATIPVDRNTFMEVRQALAEQLRS